MESILREGGNAFDAVLAGACAACVTEPVLTSIGGGGFLLAGPAEGPPRVYDFFVHTPRKRPEREKVEIRPVYADFGTTRQEFHIGLGTCATPGFIKGLDAVHRDLATMPLREIVAPAVALAREGVVLNDFQAYVFNVVSSIYTATPGARRVYGSPGDDGRLLGAGETMIQPELADLLEVIGIEGQDLFYRGEVSRAIDELCRETGCLTREDLESYEVRRRAPLTVDYRGARVWLNPPPASGGILIAFALTLLGGTDFAGAPFGSPTHLELMALVMERTNQARVDAISGGVPGESLADALLDASLLERYRDEVRNRARALRGTTHLNVMDDRGNVATLSVSNGEGSGHVVPGTGFMLNNMLGEEDLSPGGLHGWTPDERMTSMMAPTLVRFTDGGLIATGSGGSNRIRTAILQVLVNLVDHGMRVEEAVSAPRLFFERGLLSVETGFGDDAVEALCRSYPKHELWDELNLFFGGVHTVASRGGGFDGAGDPRRSGVSIVVD
jgi:gamma-glutamyltranspeptidase/glutathione hydrolase